MRDERPVCYVPRFDCHALTRFEDIWTTARDGERFSVEQGTTSAQLLTRKPVKIATVALANKTARIARAVMARNEVYAAAAA